MKSSLLSLAFALLLFTACTENREGGVEDGLRAFSEDSLARNISILASDSFEGRKPFSAGEAITIGFLKEEFIRVGLEPGNGNSYFQEVPMVRISTKASPVMQISAGSERYELKGFDDYVIWTDRTEPLQRITESEIVFAGYGVVAPEYDWNDYAGLDVKDKIVLVRVNDPGFHDEDTSLFKGKTMTYYGRWTYKFEEAARQGAKGCLIIHDTAGASYPFTVVQNNWNGSRLRLDDRGKTETLCPMIGWVTGAAAERLMSGFRKQAPLRSTVDKYGPRGPIGAKLSATIEVSTSYDQSTNVIGKITGSKYPDETIIYTAHWDHLGIGKPDETGDSIYNGALDNASATAGLVELARAFKNLKIPVERTIVFLSVTAEEQGLWGSAYYAANPVYSLDKTVANINMDGLNWFGRTKDVEIIGQDQNELEDYLREAARNAGREVAAEQKPEAGYYYRSDHFNFAKVGVPALYISTGSDLISGRPGSGKEKREEYTRLHYHRPSDEYHTDSWRLDGAIEDLKLLFTVGYKIATGGVWPKWNSGSEFRAAREKR